MKTKTRFVKMICGFINMFLLLAPFTVLAQTKAMPWLGLLLEQNVSCTVELRVEVPEATAALGGSVFVAGDLMELGGWSAAGSSFGAR